MTKRLLIVGLGNPGKEYTSTRHNIGFEVVNAFAKEMGWKFKNSLFAKGKVAKGNVANIETILLQPKTYMNRSGIAVKASMRRFLLEPASILVLSDDIALPLGKLRLREKGSSGGHNGLRSIEEALGSQNFARLRVGVGDRAEGDLKDYVLSCFEPQEKELLAEVIQKGVEAITCWITEGINVAMQKVNAVKS
jgi:PTH1 family peptidyl-tRNA hydrolase